MSHKVHASTTGSNCSLFKLSTSSFSDSSIISNSFGKESHKLKHLLQPWQISNALLISASNFSGFKKSGCSKSMGCRIGASKLPSLLILINQQQPIMIKKQSILAH